jgi:antitoxin CptB
MRPRIRQCGSARFDARATDNLRQARYITLARPVRAFGVFFRAHGGRVIDPEHSRQGLDAWRRKLLFRAWHRGMRELDLIMGRFADSTIGQLTADELMDFEQLMEVPDRELLAWVTGETDVNAKFDSALFRRLRDFNRRGEGAR